ncbi:hypothetical protein Q7P37_009988 [Cladosporium fusiforme]
MAPSIDHIYIETAINLPGSPSAFNGYRLDVHGDEWPADRHNELLTIAKRQAVALGEKLRDAGFDFTDAYLKTLPPEPSKHSLVASKSVSSTSVGSQIPHRALTLPLVDHRSSPVQSIEDPSSLPKASAKKETSSIFELTINGARPPWRISHSETPSAQCTLEPVRPPHAENTAPSQRSSPFEDPTTPGAHEPTDTSHAEDTAPCQKSPQYERETPGLCPSTETPSVVDACNRTNALPAKDTTQSHGSPPSERETPGLHQPAESSFGRNKTLLGHLGLCVTPGLIEPEEIQSPSLPPSKAKSTNTRKRKRQDKGPNTAKRQHKSSQEIGPASSQALDRKPSQAMDVAARLAYLVCRGGAECLEGGPEFTLQTFQSWDDDLSLLKPDRAQLTLEALGPQQRVYTTSLHRTGAVADIVHSWCIIAYEYQLSTRDRGAMARREQSEARSSIRLRSRGVIVAEAHRLLAKAIGMDAYKLCPALLAGISVKEPFPSLRVCRDWSVDQLKDIAGLWVDQLLTSEEKSWMQIDQQYAIDPAAQIVAQDFS